MWYDSGAKEYADINYQINHKYCLNNGLDLIVSAEERYTDGRAKHWEKLPMLLQYLIEGYRNFMNLEMVHYDYVIWIDSDAHFYIDSPNITKLIKDNPDSCFIFSDNIRNINIWEINSGFFIVKNCPQSIEVLKMWAWNCDYKRLAESIFEYQEQAILWYIFKENLLNIREISLCLEYGFLQHFRGHGRELLCMKNSYHTLGLPFVSHYAGIEKADRVRGSMQYYNDYVKERQQ